MSKTHTPFAIIYDFDGTLAPGNMQEHHFLPQAGVSKEEFWAEVSKTSAEQDADNILVYMELMRRKAQERKMPFNRAAFAAHGAKLGFFDGVEDWFERISEFGRAHGVRVEHYLVTSGNDEIVRGTTIANRFEKIFGSKYLYDENDVAMWPALAINYTTKTQYLFRINKGVHTVSDNKGVNKFVEEHDRPVPFENMAFVGDGETDIPCFRLIKEKGGLSVAVYPPRKKGGRTLADGLLADGRVHSVAPADYTEGKKLDELIKAQIEMIAVREKLRAKAA